MSYFRNSGLKNLAWAKSDHRPIEYLEGSKLRISRGQSRQFRFEELWTRREECKDIIAQSGVWSSNVLSGRRLQEKLGYCVWALSKWGRGKNSNLWGRIKMLRNQIRLEYAKPLPLDFSVIHRLKANLDAYFTRRGDVLEATVL